MREKLARSGATERHAFIYLPGFTSAPFSASDLLMRNGAPLPAVPPSLPVEVTDVWAVSTWSTGDGFRWSSDGGWMRFAKTFSSERASCYKNLLVSHRLGRRAGRSFRPPMTYAGDRRQLLGHGLPSLVRGPRPADIRTGGARRTTRSVDRPKGIAPQ